MWNNEVTNINYILGRYPCEITKLPIEPMFPTQLGVYLRKNSSLTKVFEYVFFCKGTKRTCYKLKLSNLYIILQADGVIFWYFKVLLFNLEEFIF